MKLRLQALRSLCVNYKWRGVYVWLKGRQRCRRCKGNGWVWSRERFADIDCPVCRKRKAVRGYRRILAGRVST